MHQIVHIAQRRIDGLQPSVALDDQRYLVAGPAGANRLLKLLAAFDVFAADFADDVAAFQAGPLSGQARRISERGYAAALVDFFGRQGDLPEAMRAPERTGTRPEAMARAMQRAQQLTDERFLADMQAAVDDLQARGASQVACWGFCMGGRLADVSAARVRGLSGAVAYYGHLQAEPSRLSPLELAAEIRIPLLGVFGGADPNITSDQIVAFRDALKTDAEIVTYPGAPHGFLRYGATAHKAAIDDALQRTYRFFDRVLTAPAKAASR